MYTQDSFGLGHLRRATNLANELVARRADLSVLLVADSPVAPFFELAPRIDTVKLPTVVKVDAGVYRPGRLHGDYEQVRALRSSLLREIILRFAPHVLLVDHVPGGANRELVPGLTAIRRRGLRTRVLLGLRDIIDDPAVTCALWQREGVYELLRRNYDHVLVYGAPDVFATVEEYHIADAMGERVRYCGYLCNTSPVEEPGSVRARLCVGAEPLVLVMGGGGADAFRVMQTTLEAARILRQDRSFATVLVPGPFLPEPERKSLQAQARALGVHTSAGDALGLIQAADVVVCMAGYNTLSEVLRFEKRAIVVPRPGPSAEQRLRARAFAQRGLLEQLELSSLEPAALARALGRALDPSFVPAPRAVPALDGLARASAALLGELAVALAGRRPRAPGRRPTAASSSGAR